jgi:hypothetical protein
MQTASSTIDLEELARRIQALDGAETKQDIVRRLADVIEQARARGASYKTICAALHADVPLTVPTLKTYLRRAKRKPVRHGDVAFERHGLTRGDVPETPEVQPVPAARITRVPNGRQEHSPDDIIRAGSFTPRADRSDI